MSQEAIKALETMRMYSPGFMSIRDPWFKNWYRVPEVLRKTLQSLRSDDLRSLRPDVVFYGFDAKAMRSYRRVMLRLKTNNQSSEAKPCP